MITNELDALVARLREPAHRGYWPDAKTRHDAADAIAALRAEVERLQAAHDHQHAVAGTMLREAERYGRENDALRELLRAYPGDAAGLNLLEWERRREVMLHDAPERCHCADVPDPADPLAQPGFHTSVIVHLPDDLYTPLWREAAARDTTVSSVIVAQLRQRKGPGRAAD